MRTQKLLLVSATMLATTALTTMSFADNTTSPPATTTPAPGAATVNSSTVMTPSSPSVPTTSTTVTTQGTTTSTVAPTTPATTPTSTTTTTSAEEATATRPQTPTAEPRETMTVYKKERPNKAVLITGGALFVSTYVTTAAFAAANGPIGDKDLYIPIVGPWINLADRSCSSCSTHETRDTVLIAGSGALQGIGAALLVASFFIPEKAAAATIAAGPVKMTVAPSVGGLGAVGTF